MASALENRVYQATLHDRFIGFPAAPAHNPSFLYDGQKYTGLGWIVEEPGKQVALISPKHVVFAKHYGLNVGHNVRFLNASGNPVSRSIVSVSTVADNDGSDSDVIVAELSSEIVPADGVTVFPYYYIENNQGYEGLELVVFGHTARAGRGTVSEVALGVDATAADLGFLDVMVFEYIIDNAHPSATAADAYAIVGDSGSPSFHVVGGKASIIGIHSAVGVDTPPTTRYNYDSFIKSIVPGINTILSADGYHMTRVNPLSTTLNTALSSASLRAKNAAQLSIHLHNANLEDANNIIYTLSFPAGKQPNAITGVGWVCQATSATTWICRRGGIAKNSSATLLLDWAALPVSGSFAITVTHDSDESSLVSTDLTATILPSYQEWADVHGVGSLTQDPDGDCRNNLTEYAFGTQPLTSDGAWQISRSGPYFTFAFPLRKDAAARGLDYVVKFSSDLQNWTATRPALATYQQREKTPIDVLWCDGVLVMPMNESRRFIRVEITLDE